MSTSTGHTSTGHPAISVTDVPMPKETSITPRGNITTSYLHPVTGHLHNPNGAALDVRNPSDPQFWMRLWYILGENRRADGPATIAINPIKDVYAYDWITAVGKPRRDGPAVVVGTGLIRWEPVRDTFICANPAPSG